MNKTEIIPSIIANNQKELDKIFDKIRISQTIHLDVMDGIYVPNKSLWFDFKGFRHNCAALLMTMNPETLIRKHNSEIKTFIVHPEAIHNVDALIDFVHSVRCRIFLALKPSVSVSAIRRYLRKIDGVLIMTVQPGKYGAPFMRNMIGKIRQLRGNKKLIIEVDGSVNDKTIGLLKQSGANRFSVGSYIQKSKDVKKTIESLEK